MTDAPGLRCPTCGAPLDVGKLRPGETAVTCDYCGTVAPVTVQMRPPIIRVTNDRAWVKGGWAGDPRVWFTFVLLLLGLVSFLVFGDFGPK